MIRCLAGATCWLLIGISIVGPGRAALDGSSEHEFQTGQRDAHTCQVCIPDTMYAVAGRPLHIRYDQLIAQTPPNADVGYACQSSDGFADSIGFHLKPAATSVATVTFTAAMPEAKTSSTASTHIRTFCGVEGSGLRSVLFVGDSLIAAHPAPAPDSAYVVTAVRDRFEAAGGGRIRLVGTAGCAPGLHEGYNGKRWVDFTSPSSSYFTNPFWDPIGARIDFQRYMATTGQAGPIDYCVVQLGYNDIFCLFGEPLTEQILAQWTDRIDMFCDALLSLATGYPDCRIVLSLPASGNARVSAWVDDYGSAEH